LLPQVRLAVPRAVITPSVMTSSAIH